MIRVLVWFMMGLAVGMIGVYLACTLVIIFAYENIDPNAFRQARSTNEYDQRVTQLTSASVVKITLYGGLVCAALCAGKAAWGRPTVSPRHTFSAKKTLASDKPLNPTEFERVLQSCLFINVQHRSPAFLQGLIVGRLVDSSPELAAKIEKFSEVHMAAVLQDVLRFARTR